MTTVALTRAQYTEIIETIKEGATDIRPNPAIATALQLEANLGMRIGDILKMRLADIVKDGDRYRLNVTEEKTDKHRTFTVPQEIYLFLLEYANAHKIGREDYLFPGNKGGRLTVRAVQKYLARICDLLELENVSTHSFRKFFAVDVYQQNGNDIALVQTLLQHSSPATTRRYITISTEQVEQAIAKHTILI